VKLEFSAVSYQPSAYRRQLSSDAKSAKGNVRASFAAAYRLGRLM
jgi:hypothetical protein